MSDFIRICSDIGPLYVQGASLAAALTQSLGNVGGPQEKVMKGGGSCFRCGKIGHFAKECTTRSLEVLEVNRYYMVEEQVNQHCLEFVLNVKEDYNGPVIASLSMMFKET